LNGCLRRLLVGTVALAVFPARVPAAEPFPYDSLTYVKDYLAVYALSVSEIADALDEFNFTRNPDERFKRYLKAGQDKLITRLDTMAERLDRTKDTLKTQTQVNPVLGICYAILGWAAFSAAQSTPAGQYFDTADSLFPLAVNAAAYANDLAVYRQITSNQDPADRDWMWKRIIAAHTNLYRRYGKVVIDVLDEGLFEGEGAPRTIYLDELPSNGRQSIDDGWDELQGGIRPSVAVQGARNIIQHDLIESKVHHLVVRLPPGDYRLASFPSVKTDTLNLREKNVITTFRVVANSTVDVPLRRWRGVWVNLVGQGNRSLDSVMVVEDAKTDGKKLLKPGLSYLQFGVVYSVQILHPEYRQTPYVWTFVDTSRTGLSRRELRTSVSASYLERQPLPFPYPEGEKITISFDRKRSYWREVYFLLGGLGAAGLYFVIVPKLTD